MNDVIQRKNNLLKNRKGFTLIELIVVIVIIGILAAIVIPRLAGFQATARYKADVATAKTIATAAVTYMTENDESTFLMADLTPYFDGEEEPLSALDDTAFNANVTSGGGVQVEQANGVVLYPNPERATPPEYQ